MNRFVAIAWNERSEKGAVDAVALMAGIKTDESWRRAWEKPGLQVFEAPPQSSADTCLEADNCFFVGAVFDAAGAKARPAAIDVKAAAKSAGGSILGQVWGRYVAFIRDEEEACLYVLRDPSGALPCFIAKSGWAYAFFSNPCDVGLLDLECKTIEWVYVAQRLCNNRAQSERTGLVGVSSLAPGWVARFGQGRLTKSALWRPARIAANTDACGVEEATARLKAAVDLSCSAWARSCERAALRLSGGLDSAIVLGAIRAHTFVEALNFATPNAEGDERRFARAAAAFAQTPLSEVRRDPESVDLRAAMAPAVSLNPPLWVADGETDRVEAAFARAKGIKAFFSGRGGDNAFFRSEQPHVLADWLSAKGVGPEFWRRAWIYASASGEPLTGAIGKAFALAFARHEASPRLEPALLTRKARDLAGEDETPERGEELSPGKRLHVRALEDRLNYFDYRPHADYIYPLVSQPVIETCLRLPTFVLSPAGGDRALARLAFSQQVAPQILARQSKGRTNAYLARILMRHLPFLRPTLLDGELAGQGLVDRDALSAALTEGALMRSMDAMAALVGLLGVEAWLRSPPIVTHANEARKGCADTRLEARD